MDQSEIDMIRTIGMLGVTVSGLIFTPAFYVVVSRITKSHMRQDRKVTFSRSD